MKRFGSFAAMLTAAALVFLSACGSGAVTPTASPEPTQVLIQNRGDTTPTPAPQATEAPQTQSAGTDNSVNNSANSGLCLALSDASGNYYLYMCNKDTGGYGGTFCMTADGVYNVSDEYCQNMVVYDSAMYYSIGNKIYTDSIMMGNRQELFDNGSWILGMCAYDGCLYFIDSGCIMEYDLSTGDVRDLAEAYYPYAMTLCEGCLFYITQDENTSEYYVNFIDLDGGGEYNFLTSEDPLYFMTAMDNYIYVTGGAWIIQYDALTGEGIDYAEYKFNTTYMNAYDGYIYCNLQELNGIGRIPLDDLTQCEYLAADAKSVPYAISVSSVGSSVFINYIAANEDWDYEHYAVLVSDDGDVSSGLLDDIVS